MSENPPSSHSSCSEAKKVDQNLLGIPVSDNAEKIATMLGKLVRAHVPISYISWNKVPGIYKDNVWNELVVSILICLTTTISFNSLMVSTLCTTHNLIYFLQKIYELDPLSKEMF